MHAVLYLLALGALLAVADLSSSWTFDDGAYATEVKITRESGDWAYPYRWADRDPKGEFAPVPHGTFTDEGAYPYVKRPAWILVLRASSAVFGSVVGLYVPSVLGAVAAALVAWALAERLRPGSGPIGFWAVAVGPLLVHTSAMWAHSCGAALGGVLALVVFDRAADRPARWHVPALLAAAVALVSIRTEGLLVCGAAAAVLTVLGLRAPAWGQRSKAIATTAAPLAVAAVATYWLTGRWATHLAPGPQFDAWDLNPQPLSYVQSQWGGFWRTFLDGGGTSRQGSYVAALAVTCWVGSGLLLGRRNGSKPLAAALGGAGVALLALRQYSIARFDFGGTAIALPIVAVALAVVAASWGAPRRDPLPGARWLAAFVGLHAVAIVATQYPEGGASDWGGRFVFVVLVPATVLAILVIVSALADRTSWSVRESAVVVLVALVALPTACGWGSTFSFRHVVDRTASELDVPAGDTVLQLDRHIVRGAWRMLPDQDVLAAEVDSAPRALAMLRPGLDHQVVVVGVGADRVRAPGYVRTVQNPERVTFSPR